MSKIWLFRMSCNEHRIIFTLVFTDSLLQGISIKRPYSQIKFEIETINGYMGLYMSGFVDIVAKIEDVDKVIDEILDIMEELALRCEGKIVY